MRHFRQTQMSYESAPMQLLWRITFRLILNFQVINLMIRSRIKAINFLWIITVRARLRGYTYSFYWQAKRADIENPAISDDATSDLLSEPIR